MSDQLIFHVARPFSANAMWTRALGRNRKTGRVSRGFTREYSVWCEEMGWSVRAEIGPAPQWTCRFDVRIELPPTRMDTDNCVKPLLDLAQRIGLIDNDRNAAAVTVEPTDRADCLVVLTARDDLPARGAAPRKRPARKLPGKPSAADVRRMAATGVWQR